ncbi:MAG: tetratricopeptide repeat protein [Alphaproteobacteria bacterium]
MTQEKQVGVNRYATHVIVPTVIVFAGLVAYWRSFSVPFQFDDVQNIVENQAIHISQLTWSALKQLARSNRPLPMISFALNYRLHGLDVLGYHAVNLVIHLMNGLMVYALSLKLLSLAVPNVGNRTRWQIGFLAALLFEVHPVQTQAVTYVVQRMTSLGAFFGFLGTWLFLEARTVRDGRVLRFVGAIVSVGLALLCKENFFMLPVVLLALDALFIPGFIGRVKRHRWFVAGLVMAVCAVTLWVTSRYGAYIVSEQSRYGLTPGERLLTEVRVVWHYVSLLVMPLPSRLRVDYAFLPSRGFLAPPSTVFAVLGLAILAVAAFVYRNRHPLATFAFIWFFGNLLIESTVLPVDLVFEHRLYFPSLGPLLLAAYVIVAILQRRVYLLALSGIVLVCALTLATVRRNAQWNDPAALAAQGLGDGTAQLRMALTVGGAAYKKRDFATAERAYRMLAYPESENGQVVYAQDRAEALNGLGLIARDRGDLVSAEQLFKQAIAIYPRLKSAFINLAHLHMQSNKPSEAEAELHTALAIDSNQPDAWILLGLLRARAGDLAGARDSYTEAIRSDPGAWAAYWSRGRAYFDEGRFRQAAADLEQVVKLRPREPQALLELGICLEAEGAGQQAFGYYMKALEINPRQREAHYRIGAILVGQGRYQEGEKYLRAELQIAPHSGALRRLGDLYRSRDVERARGYYQEALVIDPRNAEAAAGLAALSSKP